MDFPMEHAPRRVKNVGSSMERRLAEALLRGAQPPSVAPHVPAAAALSATLLADPSPARPITEA